jgi:hypothetical protein
VLDLSVGVLVHTVTESCQCSVFITSCAATATLSLSIITYVCETLSLL